MESRPSGKPTHPDDGSQKPVKELSPSYDPARLLGWARSEKEGGGHSDSPQEPDALPDTSISAARARILARFETWLDEALAEEDPPEGIATELLASLDDGENEGGLLEEGQKCDLYSLQSAVTALTQEVRIQGRTFKQLSDSLTPLVDRISSLAPALDAYNEAVLEIRRVTGDVGAMGRERKREIERESARGAIADVLDVLLDVNDRLTRGRTAAREHFERIVSESGKSWWRRLSPRRRTRVKEAIEATRALEKGYTLSVSRIGESLEKLGVYEVEGEGAQFDPRLMNAVEVEETNAVPEGTVLEVHRIGYRWNEAVFRPSQVKVARASLTRTDDT